MFEELLVPLTWIRSVKYMINFIFFSFLLDRYAPDNQSAGIGLHNGSGSACPAAQVIWLMWAA